MMKNNINDCINRQAAADVRKAIEILEGLAVPIHALAAFDMAISALKAQSADGDCITDEQAIEHLQSTGWMQNHDREMYESGLREQLADDSGSYDSLIPSEDTISRQAAIECLEHLSACDEPFVEIGTDDETFIGKYEAITEISDLPPAQPEQSTAIQDILQYLDNVIHPLVSPENWNVYSELHDMISNLPSAQPERKPGKWVVTSEFEDCRYAKCNQCNVTQVFYYNKPLTNYCPNCGADMRERRTDE